MEVEEEERTQHDDEENDRAPEGQPFAHQPAIAQSGGWEQRNVDWSGIRPRESPALGRALLRRWRLVAGRAHHDYSRSQIVPTAAVASSRGPDGASGPRAQPLYRV